MQPARGGYPFSFHCDCSENAIIWLKRLIITSDCTVHFEGICMSCGRSYDRLDLTANDVLKHAAEAEERNDGGNGRLN